MKWFFFPRVLSAVFSVVVMMVLTRILGAEEYGLYNLAIVSGTFAFTLVGGWLTASIIRFHNSRSLVPAALPQLFSVGSILAIAALPLLAAIGIAILPERADVIPVTAFFTLCHGLHEVGLAALRVNKKGPLFAGVALLRPVVGISLALLLVWYGAGFQGALIGMSLGAFVAGVPAVYVTTRVSGIAWPSAHHILNFIKFGLPLAVVSSRSMATLLLTQLLLGWQVGLAAVGVFAAANTVAARMISMPMHNAMQALSADIFEAWERDGEDAMQQTLYMVGSVLIFISVPLGMLLICAPNVVAHALFDNEFAAGVVVILPGLAVAALINGVQGGYFAAIFNVSKRTGLQMSVMLLSVALHGLLSWVLIANFGIVGAVIGMLMSALVGTGAYYIVAQLVQPIPLPWADMKRGLVGAVVLLPFSLLAQNSSSALMIGCLLLAGFAAYLGTMTALRMPAATLFKDELIRALGLDRSASE